MENGDRIRIDAVHNTLDLLVDAALLEERRSTWVYKGTQGCWPWVVGGGGVFDIVLMIFCFFSCCCFGGVFFSCDFRKRKSTQRCV